MKDYAVPAQSRLTISVDGEDARLADTPVSAIVDRPPVSASSSSDRCGGPARAAGRKATCRPDRRGWRGAGRWPAGAVGPGIETYILIANTSTSPGTATVTVLRVARRPGRSGQTVPLPPNSRVNVPMSQVPGLAEPGGTNFGVLIESDGPEIVIERAIYTNFGGMIWAAGHASLGTPLP